MSHSADSITSVDSDTEPWLGSGSVSGSQAGPHSARNVTVVGGEKSRQGMTFVSTLSSCLYSFLEA